MKEALLICLCCVMFVQMGLSDAIRRTLRFLPSVISCPKCLTFWSVLAWTLTHGFRPVEATATSFALSYLSLWLVLVYDAVAGLYNRLYEQITNTAPGDAPDNAGEGAADGPAEAGKSDALPGVRK